ncbi:1-phosphofructokinase family hexose kinase [Nocardioides limicola]|uniref:1-phosphofructokinase family hexose kinase n=1 Tax=Nocardioides limicola TaxID=2803368 RepID=UPI00193C42FA|nr:hexose kinase [Nocardioides sp. DJM-14]
MIVTLTANPSIDETIALAGPLARGEVLRSTDTHREPGGKGVNISRAAVAAGIATVAVLPVAPEDAYVAELATAGVRCRPERPSGPLRVNVTLTEPDGTTTKINSPGNRVTAADLERLAIAVTEEAAAAAWVVLAGSLPPGAPAEWYAELVSALRATSARVAVDTHGDALVALVHTGASPALLKPNHEELAQITGADPATLSDPASAAAAAADLVAAGVDEVLVTLGGAGAVLVTGDGAWHAAAPPIRVQSTVGAGDSSLFGHLLGHLQGLDAPSRLALAVSYGSAAAALPGTAIPHPHQVDPSLVSPRRLNPLQGA